MSESPGLVKFRSQLRLVYLEGLTIAIGEAPMPDNVKDVRGMCDVTGTRLR